jgi:beta-1,4-mannosyl-glycoprotein beta-1,4-N-acetylglucosaminyltransferase
MVYDCFAFFNELELLELRLNELDKAVDKFVIVEATRTFQKNPKPLHFKENIERYKKFSDKIIHVVVDQYPGFFSKFRVPTTWDYGNHQKDQIIQGLKDCKENDTIIISDIDEIPDPKKIIEYKDSDGIKIFEQKLFYYYLNCLAVSPADKNKPEYWRGPVMLKKKDFTTVKKARMFRGKEGRDIKIIKDGGWHFSYLGGVEMIIKKIEALEHTEYNKEEYKDPKKLEALINSGADIFGRDAKYSFVDIDETFPSFLRTNLNKFDHLIKK